MKKVYISISALLLCANLFAQTPANRTAKTIAADVLAQMPAQQVEQYNKQLGALSTAGDEAVFTLIDMINAPGKGSNAKVDYALSGLSYYVMAKGEENVRQLVANAYIKALDRVQERETKAFIIRQLQVVGQDESVEALANLLGTKEYTGPAARALSVIGTKKAGDALKAGLMRRMGTPKTQQDIIEAIAEAKVAGAEDLVLGFANSENLNMQKVALYALSQIGTEKSLPVLAEKAKAANYTMEATGANEAYIVLLKRVAKQDSKIAEKAAKTLLKNATKAGKTQTRESAFQILLSLAKDNKAATNLVLGALNDECKDYRNAALRYASDFVDEAAYVELAKAMVKADPAVKVDLLGWFGREAKCACKHDKVKDLMIRFDYSFAQALKDQVKSSDFAVQQAAVWTMVKIGDKAYIPTLVNLLTNSDKQLVLLGQDALLVFPGDIDDAVAEAINAAGDQGKIAGLELLAARMADSKVNTVLEQTKASSSDVKKTAYATLKDVVVAKDFTQICGMLESASATEVPALQAAVISSVHFMPKADQVSTITRRMYQAGEAKKHLYYAVLASTGDQKALDMIIEGCEENTGAGKDAAVGALLTWNGIEASDYLYEIAKSGESHVNSKALDRYIELVSKAKMTGENQLLRLRKAMDVAKSDDQKALILEHVQSTGTYLALLYAGEYLDNKSVQQPAAQAVMNIALGHKEYTGDNVKVLLNKVMQVLDNPDAHYQKEAIKKHLAEMPNETGFVSMFDGKSLQGWKGLVENPIARAKMSAAQLAKAQAKADEQMRKDWKVEDGCLVFEGSGFDNLCTEKQYGDFEMYVEWMLDPAGPEADAGIYLRGTPQVQIWDTARVNVGAQVGSGGLYNNQKNISKPKKVADNKLGEWNTFYIKMVGDRVTVLLNGEKVVDNVMMENYWDRKQPIFPTEQIELQAHGSRCSFRNLYIKELERPEPFQLSEQEKKEGFEVLFDGTNMYKWQGNTVSYLLEDGCISMHPEKEGWGNLYTKKEYSNFVYRFEFQLTPGANNGIGIRTPMGKDAAYHGMEIQVLDCEDPIYKWITPYQHHGSVYGVIAVNENHNKAIKPVGEWNVEEIMADGDHIRVTVNGVVILDGNIREAAKHGTADKLEHPGLFNKKGYIGFLGHGSPVKFRNVRIKELK